MPSKGQAHLKEVTPEQASHYIEDRVPKTKPPKRLATDYVMVTVDGERHSRLCSGTNHRTHMKCKMLGPWDWCPDDGPWYCRVHKDQAQAPR
jgi:hypothetical protein